MDTTDDKLKLADLHQAVTPLVASKWYNLGLMLEIEAYVLEIVEAGKGKPEDATREMFRRWLNNDSGTGSAKRSKKTVVEAVDGVFGSAMSQMVEQSFK